MLNNFPVDQFQIRVDPYDLLIYVYEAPLDLDSLPSCYYLDGTVHVSVYKVDLQVAKHYMELFFSNTSRNNRNKRRKNFKGFLNRFPSIEYTTLFQIFIATTKFHEFSKALHESEPWRQGLSVGNIRLIKSLNQLGHPPESSLNILKTEGRLGLLKFYHSLSLSKS